MTKTINQLNEATTLADDDLIVARDTSAIEDKRISKANLQETLGVNRRTIFVGSVAEGINGLSLADGTLINIISWGSGWAALSDFNPKGGGEFAFASGVAKSNHDGISVISPTVPKVSNQTGATAADRRANFRLGAGETDSAGTGVFIRRNKNEIDVYDAGAFGDGTNDDTKAVQDALDSAGTASTFLSTGNTITAGKGNFLITSPVIFNSSWTSLKGSGEYVTTFKFDGDGECFKHGTETQYTYNNLSDFAIRVIKAGTVGSENIGIRIDKMSAGKLERFVVNLEASNQIGIMAQGNFAGSAPYYTVIDSFFISGRNNETTYTNQRGVVFKEGDPTIQDSPNACIITNVKRVAGLHVAFDIEAGNANFFSDVNLESIFDAGFRFNNRSADFTGTATSGTANSITDTGANFSGVLNGTLRITSGTGAGYAGYISNFTSTKITLEQSTQFEFDSTSVYEVYKAKANNNKIQRVRHEGTNTDYTFDNRYGGFNNTLFDVWLTGVTTPWRNQARDSESFCSANTGQLSSMTFIAENLPAGTSTIATPAMSGFTGGLRLPRTSQVIAVSVAAKAVSSTTVGNATVKLYRAGTHRPELDTVINKNNFPGFSNYISEALGSSVRNWRNTNLGVQVETSADWDATNGDLHVTVWFIN